MCWGQPSQWCHIFPQPLREAPALSGLEIVLSSRGQRGSESARALAPALFEIEASWARGEACEVGSPPRGQWRPLAGLAGC